MERTVRRRRRRSERLSPPPLSPLPSAWPLLLPLMLDSSISPRRTPFASSHRWKARDTAEVSACIGGQPAKGEGGRQGERGRWGPSPPSSSPREKVKKKQSENGR